MDYLTPQDFATQQTSVAQQKAMAEALRRRAAGMSVPGGQMIGKGPGAQFVGPSWTQMLNPVVAAGMGSYYGQEADKSERALEARAEQARQQWQSALPKAVAQQTAPYMAPGIDGDEPIGQTITQKAEPLTSGRILKHTMAGMDIPGNERAAAVYNQGAMGELARDDAQAARIEEQKAAQVAAAARQQELLATRLEEARLRSEDRAADRASREQAAREARALQAELGRGNLEIRRLMAGVAQQNADTKKSDTKNLSDKARRELDEAEAVDAGLTNAIEGLNKSKDTMATGYLSGVAQNVVPGGSALANKMRDEPTKNAIQQLTYFTDEIRHGRFGSALTQTEKAAASAYLPSEFDDLPELKRKAGQLQKLVQLNNRRLRGETGGGASASFDAPPSGIPPDVTVRRK